MNNQIAPKQISSNRSVFNSSASGQAPAKDPTRSSLEHRESFGNVLRKAAQRSMNGRAQDRRDEAKAREGQRSTAKDRSSSDRQNHSVRSRQIDQIDQTDRASGTDRRRRSASTGSDRTSRVDHNNDPAVQTDAGREDADINVNSRANQPNEGASTQVPANDDASSPSLTLASEGESLQPVDAVLLADAGLLAEAVPHDRMPALSEDSVTAGELLGQAGPAQDAGDTGEALGSAGDLTGSEALTQLGIGTMNMVQSLGDSGRGGQTDISQHSVAAPAIESKLSALAQPSERTEPANSVNEESLGLPLAAAGNMSELDVAAESAAEREPADQVPGHPRAGGLADTQAGQNSSRGTDPGNDSGPQTQADSDPASGTGATSGTGNEEASSSASGPEAPSQTPGSIASSHSTLAPDVSVGATAMSNMVELSLGDADAVSTEPPSAAITAQEVSSDQGRSGDAVWRQVQRAIGAIRNLGDGDHEFKIRLTPQELGSITIDIKSSDAGLAIGLVTETSAASDRLNEQRDQLLQDLAKSGLDSTSVDISQENSGFGLDYQKSNDDSLGDSSNAGTESGSNNDNNGRTNQVGRRTLGVNQAQGSGRLDIAL